MKTCYFLSLLILSLPSGVTVTSAAGFVAGKMAEGAPAELEHWGQLVGQWSTREERRKPDGSGWQTSKNADWDFFWAYDGWGIQDNYTSPPKSETLEDERKRQRGINLRIYNPNEKKWVMTWLMPSSRTPQNFTATSTMDQLVMLSDEPDAQGNHHRITFFDISNNRFEWKLEWSKDQHTWLEVYRIHGSRR